MTYARWSEGDVCAYHDGDHWVCHHRDREDAEWFDSPEGLLKRLREYRTEGAVISDKAFAELESECKEKRA